MASEVHDLLVKTHPADVAKISEIKQLVAEHFDVADLLGRIDRVSRAPGPLMGGGPGAVARIPVGRAGAARLLRIGLRRLSRRAAAQEVTTRPRPPRP